MAGPGLRPPAIPGMANARHAPKAAALWAWGGKGSGGVTFQPPKPPPLTDVKGQAGAKAAKLLIRPGPRRCALVRWLILSGS